MTRYDPHKSDLEMLSYTIRSTGIDPRLYPEGRKMSEKGKRHRPIRQRRLQYSVQTEVALPKLKFLEGKDE